MRQRFFTAYEVAQHNSPTDCWVSIFDAVLDLTDLLKSRKGSDVKPLLEHAGRDISHWFDKKTRDVKKYLDAASGLSLPYCPQGRFVHVPPSYPSSDFDMSFLLPWWKDPKYEVGKLTRSVRVVKIKNTLTGQEDKLEVPEEETIMEIRQRYLKINKHATAYGIQGIVLDTKGAWHCTDLDLDKTLTENGIPEDDFFEIEKVALEKHTGPPVIFMHWMDDLSCL